MRLRTGRLSLCKWFPPGVANPQFSEKDLDFVSITGESAITENARVSGAVFTVLVPMGLGN